MLLPLETLSLTELIRLRERLSDHLVSGYERMVAIVHVEPPPGPAAQPLPGQTIDELALVHRGWVAPDPRCAVLCFGTTDAATVAAVELMQEAARHTPRGAAELRVGLHFASLLTDGTTTLGEGLEVAHQVAASGQPGELRLTRCLYADLSGRLRVRCRELTPRAAGSQKPELDVALFEWREVAPAPSRIRCRETGQELLAPLRAAFVVGRADEATAGPLVAIDAAGAGTLGRPLLRLQRELDGLFLYPLVDGIEVDDQPVAAGERARVELGTRVALGAGQSILFHAGEAVDDAGLSTVVVSPRR